MHRLNRMNPDKMMLILNRIPFFKRFSPDERRRVIRQEANFWVAEPDELIIQQDTLDTAFYILMNGHARVFIRGQDQDLAEIRPGEFFGEIAFVQNSLRTTNVAAVDQCVLLKVDRAMLGALGAEIREKIKDQIIEKLANIVTAKNDEHIARVDFDPSTGAPS